ncbi:hypothetical protein HELRODRAFT_190449 [Helobdella robusta]|uniref:Amine oxidase n=1 Tax=Helobdella robusta TaxID=6412 RepID=T1FS02_HELRO|nr:hypothetical protein HELRODRAFT_190449 [Helobdella robusta]ESO09302.1 hypothetical protein HELRODRAFT_190449 [Helobdella robusta]
MDAQSSQERPKRNSQKKWDPNFVNSLKFSAFSKAEKRHSIAISSGSEQNEEVPVTVKKIRKRKLSLPSSSGALAATAAASDSDKVEDLAMTRVVKLCDKGPCAKSSVRPTCVVKGSNRCAAYCGGATSRWYHISIGEHYCNDCFDMFYRSNKEGNEQFTLWKKICSMSGMSDASVKMFVVDKFLPYWLRCNECFKWRMLPKETDINSDFILNFTCRSSKRLGNVTCDTDENEVVSECRKKEWLDTVGYTPFMISSPSEPFLIYYHPNKVGMSITSVSSKFKIKKSQMNKSADKDATTDQSDQSLNESFDDVSEHQPLFPDVPHVPFYFQPFVQPDSQPHALAMPPDCMTPHELKHFPEFIKEPLIYLSVRNIIVALWTKNPKDVLTMDECHSQLICKGLIRIKCVESLPRILRYLTRCNIVNTGLFHGSLEYVCSSEPFKKSVIVVGAGPAGLSAARHLNNIGCKVTVIEARDRVGGRVLDDHSMGVCVAKGAQIIPGCVNNPITLLSHQTNIKLIEMSDSCTLIDEAGKVIPNNINQYIDFHFNSLLDTLDTWKKQKRREDVDLFSKLKELHNQFMEETQLVFTETEENIMNFHMAHLEEACGAPLTSISSLLWDGNEQVPQFAGTMFRAHDGLSKIMAHMARGLDVRFNTQVSCINYTDKQVKVTTVAGTQLTCDYVIVTVPLTLLKKEMIQFVPPLPADKMNAISSLGDGILEKVAVKFKTRFWEKKVKDGVAIGHVPSSYDDRGHFVVFYDTTHPSFLEGDAKEGILTTFLTGNSAKIVKSMSDKDIISMCMNTLKKLFPEEDIPEPLSYLVTRWQEDPHAGLSYCYIPVGCNEDVFDLIAQSVDDKLFFAGEATNKDFPQTVAGAYLTGLREAQKVLELQDPLSQNEI